MSNVNVSVTVLHENGRTFVREHHGTKTAVVTEVPATTGEILAWARDIYRARLTSFEEVIKNRNGGVRVRTYTV